MSSEAQKQADAFAKEVAQFRQRWKPTRDQAGYDDQDFDTQLNYLMARAMQCGAVPALEALSHAAAVAFSAQPMPGIVMETTNEVR